MLIVSDEGHDLFTRLDTNFDRVLTPPELRSAADVLATEDVNRGAIGAAEVPYRMQLEISRGQPSGAAPPALQSCRTAEPQVKSARSGPAWFLKMDRNTDGDVSPAEFLGNRSAFDLLDVDRDGLLSPAEATTPQATSSR